MKPSPSRTLHVAVEHHFIEVDGRIYTHITYEHDYWREFLAVFDEVVAVARVRTETRVPDGWTRADGDGVRFHPLRDYLGFSQLLRSLRTVHRQCGEAMAEPGPVLLRLGPISLMCRRHLRRQGRPFAFEGLGHGGESVARIRSLRLLRAGSVLGGLIHAMSKRQAADASCANYVSRYVQRLYPTRSGREWVISDVLLPPQAYGDPRPAESFRRRPLRIITVGRLEPEKAQTDLLTAVALLAKRGRDVRCELVGGGRDMESLRRQAAEAGIAGRVVFHGPVASGAPVTALLREADLFVLPSLSEGLGRALVEAMAVGLPAVGSRVGGVPELLEDETMFPPGDAGALAEVIDRIGWDAEDMARLSSRNHAVARRFSAESLHQQRCEFWRCLLEQYEAFERAAAVRQ
jgi:glycosyltransferase involved in cell wall biosynthesis